MKVLNEISINFPSKSANESFARATAAAFAAQPDPTLEEVGDIKTAVSEAVTNCIVHAYPDCVGKIYIKLRILEGNVLEIVVRDRGLGIPDIKKQKHLCLQREVMTAREWALRLWKALQTISKYVQSLSTAQR